MKSRVLDMLPRVGVHALIIFLPVDVRLAVGRLGEQQFQKGFYAYTGSALGLGASNLRYRVKRHLQRRKRRFWHIDYLLAPKDVVVLAILAVKTSKRIECEMNRCLKSKMKAEIPVSGFGTSDCKANCVSHLLYFGENDVRQKVASLHNEILDANCGCQFNRNLKFIFIQIKPNWVNSLCQSSSDTQA